jgi:hypothetical protein
LTVLISPGVAHALSHGDSMSEARAERDEFTPHGEPTHPSGATAIHYNAVIEFRIG